MFTNFPSNIRHNINCYKFADDGSIAVFHKKATECHKTAQSVCNLLGNWCKSNKLVLNCDKNKTEADIPGQT